MSIDNNRCVWIKDLNYRTGQYIEKWRKKSLKYIEIQNNPLNNSKDLKTGEIKVSISTQTYVYIIPSQKSSPDPKVNPICKSNRHWMKLQGRVQVRA